MAVRYTQALANRARAYLSLPLTDKRSAAGLRELAEVWAAMQGLGPVECRQCQYSERHADLAAYVRDFPRFSSSDAMSETIQKAPTYSLAPAYAGETLVHDSYGQAVKADNLTDEAAEHFIKLGYGHAFLKNGKPLPVKKAEGEADEAPEGDELAPAGNPDLVAEQEAHAATSKQLADEKQGRAEDKQKSSDALKAEKEAHKATKKELTEAQKQLATAQKQLADLAEKAEQATKPEATASTEGAPAQ